MNKILKPFYFFIGSASVVITVFLIFSIFFSKASVVFKNETSVDIEKIEIKGAVEDVLLEIGAKDKVSWRKKIDSSTMTNELLVSVFFVTGKKIQYDGYINNHRKLVLLIGENGVQHIIKSEGFF